MISSIELTSALAIVRSMCMSARQDGAVGGHPPTFNAARRKTNVEPGAGKVVGSKKKPKTEAHEGNDVGPV